MLWVKFWNFFKSHFPFSLNGNIQNYTLQGEHGNDMQDCCEAFSRMGSRLELLNRYYWLSFELVLLLLKLSVSDVESYIRLQCPPWGWLLNSLDRVNGWGFVLLIILSFLLILGLGTGPEELQNVSKRALSHQVRDSVADLRLILYAHDAFFHASISPSISCFLKEFLSPFRNKTLVFPFSLWTVKAIPWPRVVA